jgi:hypothetical protein
VQDRQKLLSAAELLPRLNDAALMLAAPGGMMFRGNEQIALGGGRCGERLPVHWQPQWNFRNARCADRANLGDYVISAGSSVENVIDLMTSINNPLNEAYPALLPAVKLAS